MTIIAYPLDAVSGAPNYTGQMARQALSALFGPAPAGRPIGATSGVRPGTPATTVSISGSTWQVGVHSGVLDMETSATAGPVGYAVTAAETGSITAASASNPRIDVLSIQQNDPAVGDTGSPAVTVQYTAGVAAASPAVPTPSINPTRNMVIARINVPASGAGSASITWVAPYMAGGPPSPTPLPVPGSSQVNSFGFPAAYLFNSATGKVELRGSLARAGGGTYATGGFLVYNNSWPAAIIPAQNVVLAVATTNVGSATARIDITPTGAVYLYTQIACYWFSLDGLQYWVS